MTPGRGIVSLIVEAMEAVGDPEDANPVLNDHLVLSFTSYLAYLHREF